MALERDLLALLIAGVDPLAEIVHASDLSAAMEAVKSDTQIDLVLLSAALAASDMSGLRGLRLLREAMPIVVLGTNGHADVVKAAFGAGAHGVIPKETRAQVMLSAVKLVLAGARYVPEQVLAELDSSPVVKPARGTLTNREAEVLHSLVDGNSNKEIARQLGLEEVTISVHLTSIYRKLGVHNRTQAVKRALEVGLT